MTLHLLRKQCINTGVVVRMNRSVLEPGDGQDIVGVKYILQARQSEVKSCKVYPMISHQQRLQNSTFHRCALIFSVKHFLGLPTQVSSTTSGQNKELHKATSLSPRPRLDGCVISAEPTPEMWVALLLSQFHTRHHFAAEKIASIPQNRQQKPTTHYALLKNVTSVIIYFLND